MKLGRNSLLAIAFVVAMAKFPIDGLAEDVIVPVGDPPSPVDDSSMSCSTSSPTEIEAAIRELHQPLDHDRVSHLLFQLGCLKNSQEQERLQGLFDQQIRALMEIAALPSESVVSEIPAMAQSGLGPEVSNKELIMRIETLNLGPTATADDLRARDQLVSQIAGIRDPITRDELLATLEEKERQGENIAERP